MLSCSKAGKGLQRYIVRMGETLNGALATKEKEDKNKQYNEPLEWALLEIPQGMSLLSVTIHSVIAIAIAPSYLPQT